MEAAMNEAAAEMRYEEAALLRDEIAELRLAIVADTDGAPVPN
jgi:excinuclease UvrABC helicase subunit UvrB